MPRLIQGKKYLLAHEAAQVAGISKATLLRWIDRDIIKDATMRDRNGWRLFSETEVNALVRVAQHAQ